MLMFFHQQIFNQWHEKDMDDIRETIINYEDEGGGERDTGKNIITKYFFFLYFFIQY